MPVGGAPPQAAQAAQAVPEGRSPNGKRPRSDVATSSGPSMSLGETSSAVMEMRPLLQSTADAVQWNCDLLNALIGPVNTIEGWTQLAEPAITKTSEFAVQASPKLAELDGFGNQIRAALQGRRGGYSGRRASPHGDWPGHQRHRHGRWQAQVTG